MTGESYQIKNTPYGGNQKAMKPLTKLNKIYEKNLQKKTTLMEGKMQNAIARVKTMRILWNARMIVRTHGL